METAQIALISTPWPLFYRPSIQLGSLKAWLNRKFPERRERIGLFWRRHSKDLNSEAKPDFEGTCRLLEEASQAVIDAVPWQGYNLIGFSICFSQLTSTLSFLPKSSKTST